MRKLLLLVCFTSITSMFAQKTANERSSQSITITGKVIEAKSKQPLEYATLVLTNIKTQKVLGGITDIQGNFSVDAAAGTYDMKVEFIGFKTKTLPQKTITENLHLGTILLSEDLETLDEVEIIAEKSTVEIRLDKKIYNVGKDMTIKGGNASDVLDNVPSVNVDAEGAVSLRGNENVRILIDGKPSALVGLSGTDALRNLPADAIEKVEVITSPSARYDAEGTAGILNIILRKGKITGFNGSTNLSVGNPDLLQVSTNLNYRTKKFNLFSNLGYSHRKGPGNANSDFTYFTNGVIDSLSTETRKYDRKNNNFNGSLGLEYYLNKNSSLTGTIFYRKNKGDDIATNNTEVFEPDGTERDLRTRRENNLEDDVDTQYSLNYTNNIDDKGQKLMIDLQYSENEGDENSLITNNGILVERNSQLTNSISKLLQIDYVLPLGEKSQLELGHKADLQDLTSDFRVRNADGTPKDPDISNAIDFKQYIYAYYAQFGSKIDKFSYLLGLRAEYTDVDLLLLNTGEFSDKNYTKWFPTVNLGYEFSETNNVTLGYARRLRRPRHWFLNPFETRSSDTYVFKGNPDLNPTYTSSFDLGYTTRVSKVTLNSSLYYQFSTDLIRAVSRVETRENGNVFVRQFLNINDENRYGFELTTNYNPTKWARLSATFNYFKFKTEAFNYTYSYISPEDGSTITETEVLPEVNSDSWFARFNSRITLPAKIEWQTRIMYRGPEDDAQGSREGMFVTNLAFSKDILQDKGTLVLNVSDLFNDRKRKSYTETSRVISNQEFQWRERQITLSFTYRFNQKKKRDRQQNGDYDGGEGFNP
ncbi:TonB-dependent receptor domain-containing protein [Tenacibaculum sp. IB213877]|uniref:TonB-dependent receptor domain-containing protein n=1 Tax=Tenacibaculum sp. IB213877 TaxID=3097351 RepID=UPI002A59FC0D|nr:TonB-dependent receptor [Tenacibaculum sp. IB213877]MDY0779241.1 TonB-dependent receptor [Tenacibaculum sp. IB213877]